MVVVVVVAATAARFPRQQLRLWWGRVGMARTVMVVLVEEVCGRLVVRGEGGRRGEAFQKILRGVATRGSTLRVWVGVVLKDSV